MNEWSATALRQVRELLDDATLFDVAWNRSADTLTVRFDCLRRHPDGSDLGDRTVEFTLAGVQAVAVGYDSGSRDTRPSSFQPPRRITAEELADWPYRGQEAVLWIDSAVAEDGLDAAHVDWLAGGEPNLRKARHAFCLTFEQWMEFGTPVISVWLLAGGNGFTIRSGGVPLDLGQWEQQFAAWWEGWRGYWASKAKADERGDNIDAGGGSEYEIAIPAGQSKPPDPSYRPPAELALSLEPTDAPPQIVRALQDWFEGHHASDWRRVALVYPAPDVPHDERAKQLERWKTGHDFGRWAYARSVDRWWAEGRRACVVIRGIEHVMPGDGVPASNREAVWTFAMRHRAGAWIIDGYSQGWPGFGSAKVLPVEQKPWLQRWTSTA